MSLLKLEGKTVGLEGIAEDLMGETAMDALPIVADAAASIRNRMKINVSKTFGPSSPGEYPAKVAGHLQDSIGASDAKITGRAVTAFFGVGAGRDGAAGAAKAKADGVNIYAEANSLEFGSVTKKGARRAARPFVRSTIAAMENDIVSLLERRL